MIKIGGKTIGAGHPCFLTFEAGPTHDGVESAKALITEAHKAGGDAIKFQILDPDRLVADRKQLFTYDVLVDRETGATETVSEPLYDILARRALSKDEWREVKAHADSLGLAFFATVGFEDEIDLLVDIGCQSIKIASADVTHLPLLRYAAKTGVSLQIDTGNAGFGEIEEAVDVIRSEGNDQIIIHHCPSGYPARYDQVNLRVVESLRQLFPELAVAYSDHNPGWDLDISAIMLGANLIEKTITFDRTTRSVEHIMSLEPQDMKAFVDAIRAVEACQGSPRRVMDAEARKKALAIRRSVFANADAPAGTRLADLAVEFRRPGYGLTPKEYEAMGDTVLTRDVKVGDMLNVSDFAKA
ncbi:N-acetylneuraminate synthase family protein [Donghicola mangrovi]|uniref:N-acetylneuraminate synthase n=1 Tax=Donghicola mangrovi TaxID=2729614 RepID=A0A850QCH7_9RHOB|nr:N-acetylneuraminate synthase family protein [Donghicola mangrovi]NVO23591.1 N-acetylneuraminate synthase [Donghicola mangrovi]